MSTANEIKQLFDFSLFGGLDKKGNINTFQEKEAFTNSLNMWLLSKENDYIRKPGKGGFLYSWLMKPLSDVNAQLMLRSLKIGIEREFVPTIFVQNLEVLPNYQKRTWTVILTGWVPEIKSTINFRQDFFALI